MPKIVCYQPNYNDKHAAILAAFAQGCGAELAPLTPHSIDENPADIAVVFGWFKNAYPPTHDKRPIIKKHLQNDSLIVLESAFVRRGDYFQVSLNGFAGHSDTPNPQLIPGRWKTLGVHRSSPPIHYGGAVWVMGQLARDTQVQHVDHYSWCQETVDFYREQNIKVRFRPHPREKTPSVYGIKHALVKSGPLAHVLGNARAVVTYNSTSAVDAIIAGVPVITRDPGSIAYPVTSHNLADAVNPEYEGGAPAHWFDDIARRQWTLKEMREGLAWKHIKHQVLKNF